MNHKARSWVRESEEKVNATGEGKKINEAVVKQNLLCVKENYKADVFSVKFTSRTRQEEQLLK